MERTSSQLVLKPNGTGRADSRQLAQRYVQIKGTVLPASSCRGRAQKNARVRLVCLAGGGRGANTVPPTPISQRAHAGGTSSGTIFLSPPREGARGVEHVRDKHMAYLLAEAEPGSGAAHAVHLGKSLHQQPLEHDGQYHVTHVEHNRRDRRLQYGVTRQHKGPRLSKHGAPANERRRAGIGSPGVVRLPKGHLSHQPTRATSTGRSRLSVRHYKLMSWLTLFTN